MHALKFSNNEFQSSANQSPKRTLKSKKRLQQSSLSVRTRKSYHQRKLTKEILKGSDKKTETFFWQKTKAMLVLAIPKERPPSQKYSIAQLQSVFSLDGGIPLVLGVSYLGNQSLLCWVLQTSSVSREKIHDRLPGDSLQQSFLS